MPGIAKVSDRAKLTSRREPYWEKLSKGCFLGFRKMTSGSSGTWLVRILDSGTLRQVYRSLGDFSHLPEHQRHDAALKEAQGWLEHLGKGGSTAALTVAAACARYVAHIRETKGDSAAAEAQVRLKRDVLAFEKLAAIDLAKLTPLHIEDWRRWSREKLAPSGPSKGRKRSASTINREMNSFRAVLNLAFKDGLATSNYAWRAKLSPVKGAGRRRDVYLDLAQRRNLIAHATPHMANFVKGLSLLPLRPGALAALTVAQFERRLGVLTIGKDKAGADRKISLPDATAKFFATLVKNKLPNARMFINASGRPWTRDTWGYHFTEAAKRAELPNAATTYSLRHSTITDLIHSGVDSLTVAQLSGTSVAMIEKHYGHLTRGHARAALAALTL
jgi:site-specific recombinase XerD